MNEKKTFLIESPVDMHLHLRDDDMLKLVGPKNSETGVSSMDIETLRPSLESMSKLGIPLCVHGETKGFVMDREKEFLPIYESLAINFPNLKIIMEHISSK